MGAGKNLPRNVVIASDCLHRFIVYCEMMNKKESQLLIDELRRTSVNNEPYIRRLMGAAEILIADLATYENTPEE